MASRYEAEITISSAKDLKNVNWHHGKLQPYAVIWIDTNYKRSTRVDDAGDTSPYWNEKISMPFNSPIEDTTLYIDVVHANAAESTKPLIGSAKLRLLDVFEEVGMGSSAQRKLELKRPSGRPHGKLEIQISVREPRYLPPDHNYASRYGVPPPAAAGTRDYPPASYGNPRDYTPAPYGTVPPPYAAPPSGYPSPPPQSAYPAYGGAPASYDQPNYAQPAAYGQRNYSGQLPYEEKKKSKFGGMGTGLAVGAVAGVLGGLAISQGVDALEDHIADKAAERVEDDDGYDADDF